MVTMIKLLSAYVLRNTVMWEQRQDERTHSAFDVVTRQSLQLLYDLDRSFAATMLHPRRIFFL